MMSYVLRTCCNSMAVNMMHKREMDRMELKRMDMVDQMKHVRRNLRRRVSGIEKESNDNRLAVNERIEALWEQMMCMDYRLNFVERISLEELKQKLEALKPVDEKACLLARIDELEALVLSGKEELRRAEKAYDELEALYSNLKAAVAAATSIDDLTWVQL